MNHWLLDLLGRKRVLAVIGTAGRREDGDRLTMGHWVRMVECVEEVIGKEGITHLVSGGAAWADHSAVQVHRDTDIPLKLYLPAEFDDLRIADWYHRNFSVKIFGRTRWTWGEVEECRNVVRGGGFKDRNSLVAKDADVFLAMTFGEGATVKDGGTADTVRKMVRRGVPGYHLDLNTKILHNFLARR